VQATNPVEMKRINRIIESLLFAADGPISLKRLAQIVPDANDDQIRESIEELNNHYQDHAFGIVQIAGGFQLVTRSEYHEHIQKMYAARTRPRLSQPALEALSVIAYKQPVSRIEIEAVRGVNSDGVLGTLLERGVIEIRGRAETVGRPLLYGTTEEFLKYFGLNNQSDLPSMEEIEAMLREREEERREEEVTDRPEPPSEDAA
jgi:segregation and condensation protein B